MPPFATAAAEEAVMEAFDILLLAASCCNDVTFVVPPTVAGVDVGDLVFLLTLALPVELSLNSRSGNGSRQKLKCEYSMAAISSGLTGGNS